MDPVTSIEEYHSAFSPAIKKSLALLKKTIEEAAPGATGCIAYGMPTFKGNKNLVHYAAYKNHIGFYPAPAAIVKFKSELAKYKTSKGAIQFPLDEPLPLHLVKKIVEYRVEEDSRIAVPLRGTAKNNLRSK